LETKAKIMDALSAAALIKDGDCIAVNSFVGIESPVALHEAIEKSFDEKGSPRDLTMISAAGFGIWEREGNAEGYIRKGAVSRMICGHFGAMLSTKELVLEDRFEAYNLTLGGITHAIRAQAAGLPGAISKVGPGLFVDPRVEGPAINRMSEGTELSRTLARPIDIMGGEYMLYSLPKITVGLIKASAMDIDGNISLADEYLVGDALSIAQAAKVNGGRVIVQVDRVLSERIDPKLAHIPACLVDAVTVCPPEESEQAAGEAAPAPAKKRSAAAEIIGRRAAMELKPGDIVNIGIGIPEKVVGYAEKSGISERITLTVESGATGGLPASGKIFGAMLDPGSVYPMGQQFDFYDGGGLDICFMGGLEADEEGNVNAHRGPGAFSGVGGFANITSNTHTVVFCMTFNTKGLDVETDGEGVRIVRDGAIPKFVKRVKSVSFSGKRAVENGQRVLYVTERCVFELTPEGMKIREVYPGIDAERDILKQLPW